MVISSILIGAILISSISSSFIYKDNAYSAQININDNEYREISTFKSITGIKKSKQQQQYKGVDIFGVTLVFEETLTAEQTTIKSPVYGYHYDTASIKNDFNDDVEPIISSEEALQIGISHYIPNGDKTSLYGNAWGESEKTTTSVLYLYKDADHGINSFTLSYIVQFTHTVAETQNVERAFIVIDAKTGDILDAFSDMIGDELEQQAMPDDNVWGTGGNAKVGNERHGPMFINQKPDLRNDRTEVYAHPIQGTANNPPFGFCEKGILPGSQCEIQDTLVNTAPCAVCDAFKWAGVVFDLYDDWGPRDDNNDPIPPLAPQFLPLKFYVHYGTNYENAFYSGGSMSFGDGNTRFYPLVSLDVSSHEVAHGFTSQGSNLVYRDQSGGINEAYSDLAGEAAEGYYRGKSTVKWICGYDIDKAGCSYAQCGLRYLYNPPLDGNSIDHVDDYFNGMNVHYSSGVYNKAWYLLDTYPAWDVQDVFLLASQANYRYWGANTNYNEGVCGLMAAVDDVFPFGQWDDRKEDIRLAFQNQGVGCITVKGIGHGPSGIVNDSDSNYAIYGGVGAAIFGVLAAFMIVYCYFRRTEILKEQLTGNVQDDKYGTL